MATRQAAFDRQPSSAAGERLVNVLHALADGIQCAWTVRIEEEATTPAPAEAFVTDDPAFGIWRDREDMADVAAYVRKLRAPRYNRDSSRNEP